MIETCTSSPRPPFGDAAADDKLGQSVAISGSTGVAARRGDRHPVVDPAFSRLSLMRDGGAYTRRLLINVLSLCRPAPPAAHPSITAPFGFIPAIPPTMSISLLMSPTGCRQY